VLSVASLTAPPPSLEHREQSAYYLRLEYVYFTLTSPSFRPHTFGSSMM
jgi:hypothetical protein